MEINEEKLKRKGGTRESERKDDVKVKKIDMK